MSQKQVEGVVLNVLPFRDYDRIFTLFTQEMGVIKVIIKKSLLPKLGRGATEPLTRVKALILLGKSDLFSCCDLSIQSQYLSLRKHLSWIQAACDMASAISQSQLPHKASPDLYRLFTTYLEKIPLVTHAPIISASFYLKLMRHDGHFHMKDQCSECSAPLSEYHIARGESWCPSHAPKEAICCSSSEIALLETLNYSRSFTELAGLTISPLLATKVKTLFTNSLER